MDFYRARFRPEFTPAFDAWLATKPLQSPDAPKTPFEMPEYRLEQADRAASMTERATQSLEQGNREGETGDKYVLTVVTSPS